MVLGILFYALPLFFAVTTGFNFGFVVGAPSYIRLIEGLPTAGLACCVLYLVFECAGYILACAVGYRVGRESQKGLTRKEFLKIALIAPIHLKEKQRRLALKKELKASKSWILLCAIFVLLNAVFETATLIFFS